MNYDELEKSGRDLDALVAERVMGWVCPDQYNYWMTIHPGGTFDLHQLKATWSPSTDIAAAMLIIDKLRADGWHFSCDDFGGEPWWAEFANEDNTIGGQATGEKLELVICRAALNFVADIARVKAVATKE